MLRVAASKGSYQTLQQMRLGDTLEFDDSVFAAVISFGTLTPGHAGPDAFCELIRIIGPAGKMVFSLRVDGNAAAPYLQMLEDYSQTGVIKPVHATRSFPAMPSGEPDVFCRIFVYDVTQ